jgi:hypothetical protein
MGRMIDGVWVGAEEEMRKFEQETWGTNDMGEIREAIRSEAWQDAQDRLTGMGPEQADWEGDGDDDD